MLRVITKFGIILSLSLLLMPFAHAADTSTDRGQGVCTVEWEWGGFIFDVSADRTPSAWTVHVDMNRSPWPVGIMDAWLVVDGKKVMPLSASAGAVARYADDNLPAAIGGAGMLFDTERNRRVYGCDAAHPCHHHDRHIGTNIGSSIGLAISVDRHQKRMQEFDPGSGSWEGLFASPQGHDAKLWVHYWVPREGVKGRRAVDMKPCL